MSEALGCRKAARVWFGKDISKRVVISDTEVDMAKRVFTTRNPEEFQAVTRDHIFVRDDPPEMVLVVGPCRTGTTALSNVFARAGVVSHMQAIKSMRRAYEEGQPIVDLIIDSPDMILEKETLGLKTEAEFFDPVSEFIERGYPADKIHLIGICREPRATLASWVKSWGELGKRVPFGGLVDSFQLVNQIMDQAKEKGVRTTYYVQEAIAANEPAEVVKKIFNRTNVALGSNGIDLVDWRNGPVFGEPGSNIVFYDEPPPNFVAGVVKGKGYGYKVLLAELSQYQENLLRDEGVLDIYKKFARGCERDLGVKILED